MLHYTQAMTEAAAAGIVAYCDGGSRGNPGPSGYGVSIEDENGRAVAELSEFLGVKTNNFAEYSGLLAALEYAVTRGQKRLRVVADSELMVKQMKGQYRVNSPDLRPLWEEAKRRVAKLERFEIQHVLRNKNKRADALANQAMDRGSGRMVRELGRTEESTPESAASKGTAGVAPVHGSLFEMPGRAARMADGSEAAAAKPTSPLRGDPSGATAASGKARQTDYAAAKPATGPAARANPPGGPRTLKGFVKNGVVHLLEGELPENCFVRVTVE